MTGEDYEKRFKAVDGFGKEFTQLCRTVYFYFFPDGTNRWVDSMGIPFIATAFTTAGDVEGDELSIQFFPRRIYGFHFGAGDDREDYVLFEENEPTENELDSHAESQALLGSCGPATKQCSPKSL